MNISKVAGVVLGLSFAAALGCVPNYQYLRSALVPAPATPDWHGEPRGAGHFDLGAQVSGRETDERVTPPLPGDPGLWVPRYEIYASAMGGITDWFDLGGTVMYAHGEFATPNSIGVPPLPKDANDLWGIGPQFGFGWKFLDGLLFAGGYLSLMYVQVPWSVWELDPASGEYRLQDSDFDSDLFYRVGAFFGVRPADFVAVYAGVVATSAWVNDGFSNVQREGSTLDQIEPAWIPTIGGRFDFGPMVPLYVRTAVTFPIENDSADYFPVGWDVSLGLHL